MADTAKHASSGNIGKSSISKDLVQNGQLDMTGFRVGKQRLVAKKKKTSALKKLIVAEREVRSFENELFPSASIQNCTTADPLSHLSVDAPEFVPMGWVANSETDAPQNASTAEASAGKQDNRRQQGRMMTAVPEFVPSWCQQPATSSDAELQHVPPEASSSQASKAPATSMTDLPVFEALERVKVQSDSKAKPKAPKQPKAQTAKLEVRHYVHQLLSDELDEKVKAMLGELVRFQERARERDPLKYQKQKRFCIGMREASRSVARGKAKCLVMAPNMEMSQAEGGLDETVEDLVDICRENEVPVVFALSRNRMGKALGKNIRLSIVCILSAEGVHQEFKQIVKLTEELRKQWVMRKMALGAQGLDEDEEQDEEEDGGDEQKLETRSSEGETQHRENLASESSPSGIAGIDGGQQEPKQAHGSTSISARVMKHLEDKKAEEERKRAEEKATKDAERAKEKARKAEERKARQEERRQVQRAEAEAEKEEERRKLEEAEALLAAKKAAALKEAERQAELIRKEKERRAEEEKKRAAEQAARAALQKQQLASALANIAGEDDEDDDDDEDLPMGFNADFF